MNVCVVSRCKADVFALTTQQAFTVRNVLRSTTIGPGEQPTAAAENRTPVRVSLTAEKDTRSQHEATLRIRLVRLVFFNSSVDSLRVLLFI